MNVAEHGTLAGLVIDILNDGDLRAGAGTDKGPPIERIEVGGSFQRRVGGLDAACDGVTKDRGKSASEAMQAGMSEALVFETKLEAFDGIGDLASVELQDLVAEAFR